jgi:type IV pilus assembly protein PilB
MALRKSKTEDKKPEGGFAPPSAGAPGGGAHAEATEGPSVEECVAVGRALVEAGELEADRLQTSLVDGAGDLMLYGIMLLTRHGVERHAYSRALAKVCGVPEGDARQAEVHPELAERVDEKVARRFNFVPVSDAAGKLVVFGAEPTGWLRAEAEAAAGQTFEWRASDPKTVTSYMEQIWRSDADIDRLVATFETSTRRWRCRGEGQRGQPRRPGPVVQLVNRIVGQALRDRASDIHVEPLDGRPAGAVPHRRPARRGGQAAADGPQAARQPAEDHERHEHRRDAGPAGRPVLDHGGRPPARRARRHGRHGVRREGRHAAARQEQVDGRPRRARHAARDVRQYSKIVHAPFGMVICAGPTGAGKTTTLYATLQEINDSGKNVTTIEDPVEYVFSGINQVQTNERAGLTFASGLKALLRQDPDVILVGEVRDADTARIAVQSALTGHMVLSSLHGNDSVAAVHRLLDMGIEAFLVASAVVAVVSQRLLRRICDNCKEPYEPHRRRADRVPPAQRRQRQADVLPGVGCSYCANTGYRERIGVYELLRVTPELRRLIVGWATTEELRRLAVAQGMRTMLREAMQLVEDDMTTIPEVVKTLFAT